MPRLFRVALLCLCACTWAWAASGPAKGSLIIAGGGKLGPAIWSRFQELAGGPDALVVVIPTAAEGQPNLQQAEEALRKLGFRNVTALHTRDREVADSEAFVEPLKRAKGVWFPGGRHWRFVDSYLGTRTERELRNVLERGGVIGGTSAGASIQASYLVRGAREGNTIMMAPGYEQGFGYLQDAAVDQHLLTRHREKDMLAVIDRHPNLLGIGIDEGTAIAVHGSTFEVIGASKVAIYDASYKPEAGGERYYFLMPGERFHLEKRTRIAAAPSDR
jgi:cyanophycinase